MSQVTLRTIAMYVATRHSIRPGLDRRGPSKDLLSFGFGHSLAQVALRPLAAGRQPGGRPVAGPGRAGHLRRAYNLMVMPATVFGRIVNRVLFPVMAQVQDERTGSRAPTSVAWPS